MFELGENLQKTTEAWGKSLLSLNQLVNSVPD